MTDTFIYIRTSTKDQHPKNQLPSCMEYAKQFSTKEPDVYSEKASAYKKGSEDRKELNKALKLAREGKYKHGIFWDFDRLHRNRKRLIRDFRAYSQMGCAFHSVNQQYLEDIHKIPKPWNEMVFDLMINILGHQAEDESIKRGKRVKIAYNAGRGRDRWGRPKIGLSAYEVSHALRVCNNNKTMASRFLKVSRPTLNKLMNGFCL